ncbi:MAG: hypothetical protein ACK41T_05885 [Pseudobdellovibrio sp.]
MQTNKNTVYIIGAGFNRFIKHHNLQKPAPMNIDFFSYLFYRAKYGTFQYRTKPLQLNWFLKGLEHYLKISSQDIINSKYTLEDIVCLIEEIKKKIHV